MSQIRTILLLDALTSVWIGIGGLLGQGYLYGLTALALLVHFGSYLFSDRFVLAVHRAREIEPDQAARPHRAVEVDAALFRGRRTTGPVFPGWARLRTAWFGSSDALTDAPERDAQLQSDPQVDHGIP